MENETNKNKESNEEKKIEEQKNDKDSSDKIKEDRIRAITKMYYSNPKIQEILLEFARNREVVPRYFEGFGKRPDILQYPSDIMGLVNKGATSFHASEEIWSDPLALNSDSVQEEMDKLRKSWDLLIDIDSKYLDYSKIATKLVIEAMEMHGVKNYGIKFSGSKGFHIILSGEAFPYEYDGKIMKEMFPEWPRAIAKYLIFNIRRKYNQIISKEGINFVALEQRTKLSKEDITEIICPECGKESKKGTLTTYECPDCKFSIKRKDIKNINRELRCGNEKCLGKMKIVKKEDYFYCEFCKHTSFGKMEFSENRKTTFSKEAIQSQENFSENFEEGISGQALAGLDMVLVAPRHLFRMPYSLHEKTALASVVIEKNEIDNFSPRDASPINIKIRPFLPKNEKNEGLNLLVSALSWKKTHDEQEEKTFGKSNNPDYAKYEAIDASQITYNMFPSPIKKLLKGLKEGRKRGLFVLLTFLRSANFAPEYINDKVREWNKKNEQPLKEGYIKSQIDWHLKQTKKILPPNYDNDSFYKDLNLLDSKPEVKNPLVDLARRIKTGK